MASANLMQSKYTDTLVIHWRIRACAIACKITVSNTSSLYWEFHNIQYQCHGLICQKDTIFRVLAAPQFWRENSCQKSPAYTHANMVFPYVFHLCNYLYSITVYRGNYR
jgi:hypothetical protein